MANINAVGSLGITGSRLTSNGTSSAPTMKGGLSSFYAYPSTSQSIAANTATKIQHNSEVFDAGNMFDSTTNYRFTPTIAGYYFVVGSITMTSIADGKRIASDIYKNGALYFFAQAYSSVAAATVGINASGILYLNGSTDYIEHFCFHDDTVSRSTLNDQIYSYFMAVLVEPT